MKSIMATTPSHGDIQSLRVMSLFACAARACCSASVSNLAIEAGGLCDDARQEKKWITPTHGQRAGALHCCFAVCAGFTIYSQPCIFFTIFCRSIFAFHRCFTTSQERRNICYHETRITGASMPCSAAACCHKFFDAGSVCECFLAHFVSEISRGSEYKSACQIPVVSFVLG